MTKRELAVAFCRVYELHAYRRWLDVLEDQLDNVALIARENSTELDARWRKAVFQFDTGGPLFMGWTNGSTWNGWAMPRFEPAVMKEVMKVMYEGNDVQAVQEDDYWSMPTGELHDPEVKVYLETIRVPSDNGEDLIGIYQPCDFTFVEVPIHGL